MEIGKVLDKISAQQPKERSAVWMVGEQLKDMEYVDDSDSL